MRPLLLLGAGLIGLTVLCARADDNIPTDTVVSLKRSAVFIQVQNGASKGTGSGFVVSVDKDVVLVATNHHVLDYNSHEKNARPTPAELARSLKQAKVTVVFESGTKAEQSVKAEPIAADFDNDLAILRLSGVKDAPAPIDYKADLKLIETMPVYTFGFPFGAAIGTSKGNPAITVGKGTVSSIRNDDNGAVALVQIDGAINPGNSGGPVVDNKGQLVGVAVSRLRDGQNIGFAVPQAEVIRLMKGRLCGIAATLGRNGNKTTLKAEVEVADPGKAITAVNLHYLVLPRGAKLAKEPLDKQKGAKKLILRVAGGIATGEVTLDATDGSVYLMAAPEGGSGPDGATVVRSYSLNVPKGGNFAAPPGFEDDAAVAGPALGAKPPPGWRDFTPKDKTFAVWIPERARVSERERSVSYKGQQMKFNSLSVDIPNGPDFIVSGAIFEDINTEEGRKELEEFMRDMIIVEFRGRLIGARAVKLGTIPGKEYFVEVGRLIVRLRVFVAKNWLLTSYVFGTRDMVDTEAARLFMDSCRISEGQRQGGGGFANISPDRLTKVQGGFNDPEFVDESPSGGVLVGAEVGLGQYRNNPVSHAVRPIYRVGDSEVNGVWHGPTQGKQITRTLAKPGYAVGAVTVKNGLTVDGFSFTYMRIVNGRLDPSDSYESPWMGGMGGNAPVKIGGSGTLVAGLIGKAKADALTGLGLLYVDPSQPITTSTPPSIPPPSNPPPSSESVAKPSPPVKSEPAKSSPPPAPAVTSNDKPSDSKGAEKEPEKKSNTPLIIGILVGVICLLAGLVGGLLLVKKNKGGGTRGRARESRFDDDRPRRRRSRDDW